MDHELLAVSDYSTAAFVPAEQFTAWRSDHAALFDFFPIDGAIPPSFAAEARTYLVGNLFVGWITYPAHRFARDERKVGEGIDQFLIPLNLCGGHVGTNGKRHVEAGAGDIDVLDMTQTMSYDAVPSTVIVLGIPRPLLEAALPDARELHGLTLSGTRALGALLAEPWCPTLRISLCTPVILVTCWEQYFRQRQRRGVRRQRRGARHRR
jgi:hypothetical protein